MNGGFAKLHANGLYWLIGLVWRFRSYQFKDCLFIPARHLIASFSVPAGSRYRRPPAAAPPTATGMAINPAAKYVVFRVSSLPLIKAQLAEKVVPLSRAATLSKGRLEALNAIYLVAGLILRLV